LYYVVMTNVFLADSQSEARSALRLLVSDMQMKVVGEASDWDTTLDLAAKTSFDLLLVDWEILPINPQIALAKLRTTCPKHVSVILFSHLTSREQAATSIGADLFISKGETPGRVAEFLLAESRNMQQKNSLNKYTNQETKEKARLKMETKVPSSLVETHKMLRSEIEKGISEGGLLGASAAKLSAQMEPHCEHEEQFGLLPIGVLPELISGEVEDQMDHIAQLSDELQSEMPDLIENHKMINSTLDEMTKAAVQENKPIYLEFVQRMKLHLKEEEEVYYPAALLAGMYIKSKLAKYVQFRYP